ncbi:hypothetical protein WN51_08596 [Melipona quadrifasciata]|uniref:Uncharacterized protein n=1 Tax=Melipona quadrifasciata TaxID=166423 RepID=A0A0M9A7K0_9HYME|nr:hypothetical protein WN51_08596 [Melipona quadrifasciata]
MLQSSFIHADIVEYHQHQSVTNIGTIKKIVNYIAVTRESYLFRDREPCESGNVGMSFTIFCTKALPFVSVIKNSRPSGVADIFVTMPNNPIIN